MHPVIRLSFCLIFFVIIIQESLDQILLKTDIHSFVLDTETFQCYLEPKILIQAFLDDYCQKNEAKSQTNNQMHFCCRTLYVSPPIHNTKSSMYYLHFLMFHTLEKMMQHIYYSILFYWPLLLNTRRCFYFGWLNT